MYSMPVKQSLLETSEQNKHRKHQQKLYMRKKRAKETPEEKARRQEKNRDNRRLQLLTETPEQAERRKLQQRQYMRKKRAAATSEETTEVRKSNRIRIKLRRQQASKKEKEKHNLQLKFSVKACHTTVSMLHQSNCSREIYLNNPSNLPIQHTLQNRIFEECKPNKYEWKLNMKAHRTAVAVFKEATLHCARQMMQKTRQHKDIQNKHALLEPCTGGKDSQMENNSLKNIKHCLKDLQLAIPPWQNKITLQSQHNISSILKNPNILKVQCVNPAGNYCDDVCVTNESDMKLTCSQKYFLNKKLMPDWNFLRESRVAKTQVFQECLCRDANNGTGSSSKVNACIPQVILSSENGSCTTTLDNHTHKNNLTACITSFTDAKVCHDSSCSPIDNGQHNACDTNILQSPPLLQCFGESMQHERHWLLPECNSVMSLLDEDLHGQVHPISSKIPSTLANTPLEATQQKVEKYEFSRYKRTLNAVSSSKSSDYDFTFIPNPSCVEFLALLGLEQVVDLGLIWTEQPLQAN